MQARLPSRPRAAGAEGSRRGPQEPLHQLLQLRTPQGFAEKVAGAVFRLFHLDLQGFEEEPGEAPDGGAVVDDQHGARQRVPPRKYPRKREPFSARRPNRQTSHSAQIYGIRTIFPTTRSFSRSSWARAASARGYVFAITGRSSPCARQASSLETDAVGRTTLPMPRQNWRAELPTPPAAACTTTTCPGCSAPRVARFNQAVRNASGMAAASWKESVFGIGIVCAAG